MLFLYVFMTLSLIGLFISYADSYTYFLSREKEIPGGGLNKLYCNVIFWGLGILPFVFVGVSFFFLESDLYPYTYCSLIPYMFIPFAWDIRLVLKSKNYKSVWRSLSPVYIFAILLFGESFLLHYNLSNHSNLAILCLHPLSIYIVFWGGVLRQKKLFGSEIGTQSEISLWEQVIQSLRYLFCCVAIIFLGFFTIGVVMMISEAFFSSYIDSGYDRFGNMDEGFFSCDNGELCLASKMVCLARGYTWYEDSNTCEISRFSLY